MSATTDSKARKPGEPYCGNCNYTLTGLTSSSKCPECGKPLVEVLQRGGAVVLGKRYRSPYVIFGLPLIDVAYGPLGDQKVGHAKGIIAFGDIATGWLALGGFARGIIAIGGFATGGLTLGGMSVGMISVGGWAIGLLLAIGGGAVGGFANGGGAAGYIAQGGGAMGYYARGGGVWAKYAIAPMRRDPAAVEMFALIQRTFLLPERMPSGLTGMIAIQLIALFWVIVVFCAIAGPLALIVWREFRRKYPDGEPTTLSPP